MIRIVPSAVLFAAFAAALAAQAAQAPVAQAPAQTGESPITEARVKEVVSWLAADERQGRDSPSPGLDAAAEYIAQHFEQCKLTQLVPKSWYHGYTLPGMRLDSRAIAVTVKVKVKDGDKMVTCELKPDVDVRLLRAGETLTGDQAATVAYAGDPRVERMLMAGGGRRPVLLEVAEDDPAWTGAAGAHDVMKSRLLGAMPVFVVRKGALPPVPPMVDGDGKPLPQNDDAAQFTATWSVPAPEPIEIELRNVVGVLRGSVHPDEYVLVSAHYDHIGVGRAVDGDKINNGADDDASGTTAVVLLAEAMAKQPPPARSVLFVCFSGEEKGLRGSAAFAERPPVPLASIFANVNIEMIGRPEEGKRNKAWITGVEYSDFAAIAGPALQRGGIELATFGMAKQLFAQSDNFSLARKGVVAHSISAGSLHKDYHQPSDSVDKLDLPHMTQVIRGLLECVREFANRDGKPAYNEAGQKVVERGKR